MAAAPASVLRREEEKVKEAKAAAQPIAAEADAASEARKAADEVKAASENRRATETKRLEDERIEKERKEASALRRAAEAAAEAKPLHILGNYLLVQKLGEGSFGVVFRAVDDVKNVVAVKRFRTRLDGSPSVDRSLAANEADFASRLIKSKHANIVNVLHVLRDPGGDGFHQGSALVFEFCDRGTVHTLIERRAKSRKTLTAYEIVTIGRQILSGLLLLQEHYLVHRDLAPRNVFLHRNAEGLLLLKVGDYGMCTHVGEGGLATRKYSLHAAPEEDIAFKSDVFSVGVILFGAQIHTHKTHKHTHTYIHSHIHTHTVTHKHNYAHSDLLKLHVVDITGDRAKLFAERNIMRAELKRLSEKYGPELIDTILRMVAESPIERLNAENAFGELGNLDVSGLLLLVAVTDTGRSPQHFTFRPV